MAKNYFKYSLEQTKTKWMNDLKEGFQTRIQWKKKQIQQNVKIKKVTEHDVLLRNVIQALRSHHCVVVKEIWKSAQNPFNLVFQ